MESSLLNFAGQDTSSEKGGLGATKIWLHLLGTAIQRKKQSSQARELLRLVCAREGIGIADNELFQPGLELIEFFSTKLNLGLSVAHCSKMIAIALAPREVGIDCETKGKDRNWLGIASQFFTAREVKAIAAAGSKERESVFLRHWVLKEAYIKACRGSVFGDLNRLVVENNRTVRVEGCLMHNTWRAWELELCGCPIAVCSAFGGPLLISQVNRLFPEVTESSVHPSGSSPIEPDADSPSLWPHRSKKLK